jgi:hypothetical protein
MPGIQCFEKQKMDTPAISRCYKNAAVYLPLPALHEPLGPSATAKRGESAEELYPSIKKFTEVPPMKKRPDFRRAAFSRMLVRAVG